MTERQVATRMRLLPAEVREQCYSTESRACPRCRSDDCDDRGYGTIWVGRRWPREIECPRCDGSGQVKVRVPDPTRIDRVWPHRRESVDAMLAALLPESAESLAAQIRERDEEIDILAHGPDRISIKVDETTVILADREEGDAWRILVDCDRAPAARSREFAARIRIVVLEAECVLPDCRRVRPRDHDFDAEPDPNHCLGCGRRTGRTCRECSGCIDCCRKKRAKLWWE